MVISRRFRTLVLEGRIPPRRVTLVKRTYMERWRLRLVWRERMRGRWRLVTRRCCGCRGLWLRWVLIARRMSTTCLGRSTCWGEYRVSFLSGCGGKWLSFVMGSRWNGWILRRAFAFVMGLTTWLTCTTRVRLVGGCRTRTWTTRIIVRRVVSTWRMEVGWTLVARLIWKVGPTWFGPR